MTKEPDSKSRRTGSWLKDHRKPILWTGGIFAVLVAAVIVVLSILDWNMLRGPISRFASERTGREVAIDGDLDVHILSWKPSATVNGLRIGNPAWAGKGRMAEIRRLDVQIELLPLLRGQVILPRLAVDQPNLVLIRDGQGRVNWSFDRGKPKGKPFRMPPIRHFSVETGRLKFTDTSRRLSLDARIEATERLGRTGRGFVLDGKGSINGAPFVLDVTGGPLLNVRPNHPYPFDADVRAGATHITAKGAIPKPFDLGRFTADVTARGADLADLYELTGVALPNTPPYRLAGKLARDEEMWKVTGLGGRVGDSDMSGVLSVDTGGEHPFLRGDLKSKLLDFDDLAAIFGGAPARGGGETASDGQKAVGRQLAAQRRLLPDATLKVSRIRAMDADVKYRAESVRAPHLPLRGALVRVKLNNGFLIADPLRFDLPQGNFAGMARLDARKDTPVSAIDIRLSKARLEQLLPVSSGGAPPLTGGLVGRVKLTGVGASVREAAGNANGEAMLVVPGGEVREAFAELLGINVTKGLGLLLAKDQSKTDVRCAVAHFEARNGVLRSDRIVFDTDPVLGTGQGTIDLRTEQMNFKIAGKPKEPRLVRLMAPVTVNGPIVQPKIGVEPGRAIAQGGIAAALGAFVTPIAAILPFVDLGLAKDAACGALIAEAGREGAPVAKTASR